MKRLLNVVVLILLLLNGIAAIYGGWNFMLNPDGSGMNMSPDFLRFSPFKDYFIPGLMLFTMNGLFSFFVIASVVFRLRHYLRYVIAQSVILAAWIMIEILMLQTLD